jgi:hypothetical protein
MGGSRHSGSMNSRQNFKQIAVIYSLSTAFLDSISNSDQAAQLWLKEQANLWLKKTADLNIK